MDMFDLFSANGIWNMYSPFGDKAPLIDGESLVKWIHASPEEREDMELALGPDGKVRFEQAAKGFFSE